MSGEVVHLFPEADVDAAWGRYAAEAKRIAHEPRLLGDRAFMENLARLEAEWKRLFMAQAGPA